MNSDVNLRRERLGILYGLISGFAFAFFAWGIDGWLLFNAHSAFWWVKFLAGMVICLITGGLVGWWTVKFSSHWMALLLWGALAFLFSKVALWLPITFTPYLLQKLYPTLQGRLHYVELADMVQFQVISLIVIGLAAIIGGLAEINLVDQALLSPYISGSFAMLAVCSLLFGLAGSASDYLVNAPFREPLQTVDNLIQFTDDNRDKEIPAATARKMHLSATRNIVGLLHRPRRLTLINYDTQLGRVDILVDFDNILVKCTAIYNQPADCVQIDNAP